MPALHPLRQSAQVEVQGMTSIQVLATPMIGRDKSSSVNPTAFSIARGRRPIGTNQ